MKQRIIGAFYSIFPNLCRAAQQVFIQKIISVSFGPVGFLVFGAVSNLLSITNSLALGGVYNGLVARLTTRNARLNSSELKAIVILSLIGLIVSLCILMIVIYVIRIDWIKNIGEISTIYLAVIMTVTYIGYTLSSYVNASIVAQKKFRTLAIIGFIASGLSIFFIFLLMYFSGNSKEIILWAPAMYAIGAGIISLVLMKSNRTKFILLFSKKKLSSTLRSYLPYSGMAACSAFLTPLSAIYILSVFYRSSGGEAAGIFLALTKLSDIVTIFIGPVIATQIYPNLIGCVGDTNKLRKMYKHIFVIFLISFFLFQILAFGSSIAMHSLFTEKFVINWQISHIFFFGEAFRILSVTLGYLVISSGSFYSYLFFDIITKGLLCLVATVFVPIGGIFFYSIAYIFVWIFSSIIIIIWAEKRSVSIN